MEAGDFPDGELLNRGVSVKITREELNAADDEPDGLVEDTPQRNLRYNMGHKKRGIAIVINNIHFDKRTGMSTREGAEEDTRALCREFHQLGFEVKVWTDLNKRDMKRLMKTAAHMREHSENDCFVCVMISHGEQGLIYGTDGTIEIDQLLAPFKDSECSGLAGKPKLFFIQACRGNKLDRGIEVRDSAIGQLRSAPRQPAEVIQRIPVEADFLICYASVVGFFCFKSATGSWFMQSLCHTLKRYGTQLEILQIMTRVTNRVAYDFQVKSRMPVMHGTKQCPCFVSTLTKELYFTPK